MAVALLTVALVAQTVAQEPPPLAKSQSVIGADQLKAASQAVVQPNLSAATPAAQKSINLADFKAALGSDVRLSQYDPATKASKDIGSTSATQLRVGEYLAVASDRIQLAPLQNVQGRVYSAFPGMLITTAADGSTRNLRVDNYSEGFSWNKAEAGFDASIAVAVSDLDNPSSNEVLVTPIAIKVSGPALVGSVPPIEIGRLGFGGEKDLTVRSEGRDDPVAVTLRHEIDPNAPQNLALPLRRPKLTVSANPAAIAAFGIEATEITINSNGTLPEGFALTLDSDGGTFEPKTTVIRATGTATSRLWSAGTGSTKVRVLDERFEVSEATVTFSRPDGFLVALALGAAFGASFVYFWQRAKGSASGWGWCAAWVFGVGITVALFAGFEIPQMLDLPQGRAGLVVPAATAFIAAILTSTVFAALSGNKKADAAT